MNPSREYFNARYADEEQEMLYGIAFSSEWGDINELEEHIRICREEGTISKDAKIKIFLVKEYAVE